MQETGQKQVGGSETSPRDFSTLYDRIKNSSFRWNQVCLSPEDFFQLYEEAAELRIERQRTWKALTDNCSVEQVNAISGQVLASRSEVAR